MLLQNKRRSQNLSSHRFIRCIPPSTVLAGVFWRHWKPGLTGGTSACLPNCVTIRAANGSFHHHIFCSSTFATIPPYFFCTEHCERIFRFTDMLLIIERLVFPTGRGWQFQSLSMGTYSFKFLEPRRKLRAHGVIQTLFPSNLLIYVKLLPAILVP